MSSVLIRGMKMPTTCEECDFCHWSNLHQTGICDRCGDEPVCPDYGTDYKRTRARFCPLIELPEKHGRLVDADALHVLFENQWHYLQCLNWDENPKAEEKQTGINWCINTLHDDAPTIIEAEGE